MIPNDARTIAEEVLEHLNELDERRTSIDQIEQALESYGKEQYEKGGKEERLRAEPVIELARRALTCSRAANNKQELWDAWADNLEQKMKNVLAAWDDVQK